ncbi:MAG TPA: twin-arginine translocase TatA/TatE family subunit, partial [Blastocatellia bacterium]|nr:twin-arginine translocase TatA/TatE family subunit [Blastocatellia bacterium]
ILILVVALVLFGPRKLPELGKSLGQAMSQFRRASEDFKRTWEQEVDLEKERKLDSGDASHAYSTETHPYEGARSEPEAAGAGTQSSAGGQGSNAESAPSGAEATQGGTTPEPALVAKREKQHWI